MKIKNVKDLTIEECQEYLKENPNGSERTAVEDRMNTILKQNAYIKEQDDKQKRLEQKQYENDVKWIDIKQFLANHKYRRLSGLKTLFCALLLSAILSRGLYEKEILGYHTYELSQKYFAISSIMIVLALLMVVIINSLHSPSLHNIYNIEKDEKTKSYRRTQNENGKYGLHQCKKYKIVQVLPFEYNNIYYCGGDAYICVKGNKRGVYNTIKKKMVIDVVYDTIDIMQDGTLVVVENGISSRLTTDGYRIIE